MKALSNDRLAVLGDHDFDAVSTAWPLVGQNLASKNPWTTRNQTRLLTSTFRWHAQIDCVSAAGHGILHAQRYLDWWQWLDAANRFRCTRRRTTTGQPASLCGRNHRCAENQDRHCKNHLNLFHLFYPLLLESYSKLVNRRTRSRSEPDRRRRGPEDEPHDHDHLAKQPRRQSLPIVAYVPARIYQKSRNFSTKRRLSTQRRTSLRTIWSYPYFCRRGGGASLAIPAYLIQSRASKLFA